MANCKFCKKDISWIKEGKKNVPIEADGGKHSCQEMKDTLGSLKKVEAKNLDPELVKKYEASINKKFGRDGRKKKPVKY